MADWLPAGWTVEVKVRKDGRKDRYYTDPASGYVFRSMKDVFRYLTTGERGRRRFKSKDIARSDVELEDKKISTSKGSEPKEERSDPPRSVVLFLPAFGAVQAKQPSGKGVVRCKNRKTQLGLCGSKDKKDLNLSRRALKPLVQVEVNPTLELETSNQAHQVAGRHLDGQQTSTTDGFAMGSWAHGASLQFDQLEAEPGPKCASHTSSSTGASLELKPFSNLTTPEEKPFSEFATLEKSAANVGMDRMADEKRGCTLTLPLGNPVIPKEQAEKVETESKAEEKPGSPLILPFGDSWPDPCIEFAIKTLTGAIPVGDDINIQDFFQQQLSSSSQTQRDGGSTLPDVSLDGSCQTDILPQFNAVEKSLVKQALEEPSLPHTGNVSAPNSGETGLHQLGERE